MSSSLSCPVCGAHLEASAAERAENDEGRASFPDPLDYIRQWRSSLREQLDDAEQRAVTWRGEAEALEEQLEAERAENKKLKDDMNMASLADIDRGIRETKLRAECERLLGILHDVGALSTETGVQEILRVALQREQLEAKQRIIDNETRITCPMPGCEGLLDGYPEGPVDCTECGISFDSLAIAAVVRDVIESLCGTVKHVEEQLEAADSRRIEEKDLAAERGERIAALEEQLAAERAEKEEIVSLLDASQRAIEEHGPGNLRKLRAENERLRGALKELRRRICTPGWGLSSRHITDMIDAALNEDGE